MTTLPGHIAACSELDYGDEIQAFKGDTLRFHGHVTEVMPDMELFWAVSVAGERRIIELGEFKVQLLHPAHTEG